MPFKKGHPQLNTGRTHFKKGHKLTEDVERKRRKNISKALKGKKRPDMIGNIYGFKKGRKGYWTGKKRPEISKNQQGKKNPYWKGGISSHPKYKQELDRKRELRKKQIGGSHTLGEWENLKAQYNWTCPACNKNEPKIKLTRDHIIPISKGGSDNIENIQPLCISCNCKKHTKIKKYVNSCRNQK